MKKIMGGLFVSLLLLVAVWLGVNLWPRPLEPPLWTEADLFLPQDHDKNGYHHLVALKDKPGVDDPDIPDDLYPVFPSKFPEPESELASYWDEVSRLKPALADFLRKRSEALEEYRRLLEFDQFIDQDPVSLNAHRGAPWLLMIDLRKLAVLEMVQSVLIGNQEQAYELWGKTFRLNQSWLSSARGLLSHAAALRAVQNDLILLAHIRAFPPERNGEAVLQAVSDFDPGRIGFQRAIISEYLFRLSSADAIASEGVSQDNFWVRAVFNRSLSRRDLNEQFRRFQRGQFDVANGDPTAQPFWWFYNPAGKLLGKLLDGSWQERMRKFLVEKEELRTLRSKLLAQGFPSQPLRLPPPEPPVSEAHEVPEIPPPPTLSLPRGFSLESQLKKAPDETIRKKVARKTFRKELENFDRLYTSIRAVPFFSGGKPQGLKFLSLKPGTLMEAIGFQRGDVLLAVDGIPVDVKNALTIFDVSQPKTKKKDYLIFRKGKFVRISAIFSGD